MKVIDARIINFIGVILITDTDKCIWVGDCPINTNIKWDTLETIRKNGLSKLNPNDVTFSNSHTLKLSKVPKNIIKLIGELYEANTSIWE